MYICNILSKITNYIKNMNYLKKLLLFSFFLMFSANIFAQNISWSNNENKEIISSISQQGFIVKLRINTINYELIKTEEGDFYKINIDGFGRSLDYGNPQLPIYKKLIELPEGAGFTFTIKNKKVKKINLDDYSINEKLLPSQAPILKIENNNSEIQINEETYRRNEFYNNELTKIVRLGKMRSVSLARFEYSPISYNPVENTLEVVEEIEIEVNFSNINTEEINKEKQRHYSQFSQALNGQIINSKAFEVQPITLSPNKYPLKYVIVADTMFQQSLQPFIRWKEKKGFKVIEAYMQDTAVGSTKDSIKSYLKSLYDNATANNPAPIYVLFVGDVAQMPSWPGLAGGGHVTDLYYCEYTNDEFPELMYGRFSANDTSELNPQIEKTIEYEKLGMADPSYLGNSILVSGNDASHSTTWLDGQINYGTNNYFNSSNSTNCSSYLYVNGSYTKDQEIRLKADTGASIINYTGHGSPNGWNDPTFNVANVPDMKNRGRYPLMIANACITNKFNYSVCFGEALLRAKNKGAIGYIGASDNTYWDEDYYWAVGYGPVSTNPSYATTGSGLYDLMFHNHNESYSDWAMSSSQYINVGNLAVTQGGSSIRYYWEVYHIMGDPSLMAYQRIPTPITVSNIPFIQAGWTSYSVNTVPFAQVALSKGDTLISSVIADSNGLATLQLDSFSFIGVLDLVVTAQNHAPHFSNVFGGAAVGPYVIASDVVINDVNSNNNGKFEYAETAFLNVEFSNITSFNANNLTAKIRCNDNQITIIDSVGSIANISSQDTINIDSIFKISINADAQDKHLVNCDIIVSDANGTQWVSPYYFYINAPNIIISQHIINDSIGGNNNGIIEAGESVIVKVLLKNIGSIDALNIVNTYVTTDPLATVSSNFIIDTIPANSSKWAEFTVSFDSQLQNGQFVDFDFNYISGAYSGMINLPQLIGTVDEDFESGDFSKFVWQSNSNLNWVIDSITKYEGEYSTRSAESMQNNDTSDISVSMRVLSNDTISFFCKVSTEPGYDRFHFFIDDTEVEYWSGNKGWKLYKFPVNAGNHTFKWSYIKDYYQSSYSDAVWLDYISFPPTDAWSSVENIDNASISNIRLWPNPAIDFVNVDFNMNSRQNVISSVYDQLGRLVIPELNHGKFNDGNSSLRIDSKGLNSGIYFVCIRIGEQQFFQKLIIQ